MIRGSFVIPFFWGLATLLAAQTPGPESGGRVELSQLNESAPAPASGAKEQAGAGDKAAASGAQFPFDAFKDFSATMIGDMNGDKETQYFLYRKGNLVRSDVGVAGYYQVTDLDKGDTYGVAPTQCMHDPNPSFRVFPMRAGMHGTTERVPAGKETVDGHSCTVEDITVAFRNKAAGSLKMRAWEADDLQGFPIKIEVQRPRGEKVTIRYTKVELKPQDAALFKHPARCDALLDKPLPGKGGAPAKTTPAKPQASQSGAAQTAKPAGSTQQSSSPQN